MKKHITILVFLLANLSFSQSYNYSQSKEYIISGTISSIDDDELLEYATITLLNPDDNSVITGGITDNLALLVLHYDTECMFLYLSNQSYSQIYAGCYH